VIRIERDPDFINAIANHPSVQPYIREDGAPTDWTPVVKDRFSVSGIVVLSNGEDAVGAFEATAIEPPFQAYQMHTLFAATCRGRKAIDTAKAMLAWMFAHGATLIWGATPRKNRAARWFNRQIGGRVTGGDDEEDVEFFELRVA
jgi:hypothetical protein